MSNGSPPDDRPLNRRGRPPVEGKPLEEMVSARLPQAQYRQLTELAHLREVSVSTLVRQLLIFRLK